DAQQLLGAGEHVVPEPRLKVRLQLRQVEVRALALVEPPLGAVEEVETEVEQRRRHRGAVDLRVLLVQVPAARADHDRGQLLVGTERVGLAAGLEVDRTVERLAQVELAEHAVLPERGVGVLEVGQPDLRAGVERVDGHLAVHRPGDLHPPVLQAGRGRRDLPVALPDLLGLGQEVERAAGRQLPLPGLAGLQQLQPPGAELPLQRRDERERLGREDLVEPVEHRARDLHGAISFPLRGKLILDYGSEGTPPRLTGSKPGCLPGHPRCAPVSCAGKIGPMKRIAIAGGLLASAALLTSGLTGCGLTSAAGPAEQDKASYEVTEKVTRLEVRNGSGDTLITETGGGSVKVDETLHW